MSEKAKGFRVRVLVECYNEQGEVISDIPSGNWYGFSDAHTMNMAAIGIAKAINETTAQWNEAKYVSGESGD